MATERDTAALTLASVNLHIGSLVPSASLASYEDSKKSRTSSRTSSSGSGNNNTNSAISSSASVHSNESVKTHQERGRAPSLHHEVSWSHLQLKDRMAWQQGFRMNKKGGLVFLDQETLKKQQGVFKDVMLQVGSQLLSGKLAVRISLPIRIFEPRTLLERVADAWNYAPTLLKKAALSSDPLERMKFVIAFVAGGFHFCVGQLKPFNPIVGETYEATYADGTHVAIEHVSHHPVKSAFTLTAPKGLYQLSGVYEFESTTSRNAIVNHQLGSAKVVFQDGHAISYTVPQIKMSGLLFGERVVELTGACKFVDAAHHLVGDVTFGANTSFLSKSHAEDIKGSIYPAKVSLLCGLFNKRTMDLISLCLDGVAVEIGQARAVDDPGLVALAPPVRQQDVSVWCRALENSFCPLACSSSLF